jgi:hypothetical protein
MHVSHERKMALITGATSGIGAAYAQALAEQGYDLIITGRRREIIEDVARRIEKKYHVSASVVIVELSDMVDFNQLVELVREIGPVDLLVNNAGFTTKGYYYQQDIIEQERMVLVHIVAMMKLTHTVLPGMIARRSGTIINVASIKAVTPLSLSATYCSVKAFMRNFSISLHAEVKELGVKVQCVFPGFTRTDLGRGIGVDFNELDNSLAMHWMLPEEVVRVSLRDLHKRNKVICVPGAGNKALYMMARVVPERWWSIMDSTIVKRMP